MAKLKTKFWFSGRSSSSPETSNSKPSTVVHLYHDLDAPVDRRSYSIEARNSQYTAESLCIEVAKHLNISALAFHLFGLATPNLQSFIPPNHLIAADQKLEFVFRLRFRPCDVDVLRKCSKEAFNYYFLQVRDDFLKNRIDEFMVDITLEKVLGLALLDLLRLAKELNHKPEWIKNQDPERFIPKSSRSAMNRIWDKKRIEYNFRQDVDPKYKKHSQQKSYAIKSWYIHALRMYAPLYGCEKIPLYINGVIVVEPQSSRCQIYTSKEENVQKSNSVKDICTIGDLMAVSLRENETFDVQLDRRKGFPEIIKFKTDHEAHTFMSCLEGYYRFIVDYHYSNLCSKIIYSPLIEHLASVRSYGPVDMKWARERLLSQNKANKEYNYLLLQKQDDMLSFDIIVYLEIAQHLQSNVPPVAHFIINRLPSGNYQVSQHEEPMFDSVRELLSNYGVSRSKHKLLKLNRCVPVKQPVDPHLYLCLNQQDMDPITPSTSHDDFFQNKSPIVVVPRVQIIEHNIAKGEFTAVHKASWEGDDEIITVAVKQLALNANALEYFTQSIHQAAFWNHGTVANIYALCLASPLQVVMELAELGDMETYLRNPKKGLGVLKVFHLVSAAEQIAQALTYLQEDLASKVSGLGQVHGNIRCRNILVSRPASESEFKVKLGDPGLVHLYNEQKIDHPVNHERLPWVAPELYKKLDKMTMFSDRYAFGITLWELFALAERPFGKRSPTEIMKNVEENNLEKVLPKPEQCPDELYSTMRECCRLESESRGSPKDMVKDIRAVLFRAGGREYSEPSWRGGDTQIYDFGDGKLSAEDALTDLLQRPVKLSSSASEKFSIDMKSAPILRKCDIAPLTVNLDPKSHHVVSSPPDLREFGINDAVTGQFTNGDSGVDASNLVNGENDFAPNINPKSASASNVHMDSAIQRRPLPLVPAMSSSSESTIISRQRIMIDTSNALGQGHYGKVYKGQLTLSSGEQRIIAIKSLKPKMINRFQKEFDREINIMLTLKHENIVEIIGQCPQKSESMPLLLLMEYLQNGSMDRYLRKNEGKLKDEQLLKWTLEVAEGMKYLSDQKIIHRDLAARNVLIDKNITAKISDFGLSRTLDPEKDYYRSDGEKEIPVRWCAPEVLAERKFAVESDVWSYGITVWEIFSLGAPPNLCQLNDFYSQLHRGKRLGRPPKCPEPAWKRVILPCWEFYPQHRPPFGKICATIDIVINELENSS